MTTLYTDRAIAAGTLSVPVAAPLVFCGETYTDTPTNRDFIRHWRTYRLRNAGTIRHSVGGYTSTNPARDRAEARTALRALRAWYPKG